VGGTGGLEILDHAAVRFDVERVAFCLHPGDTYYIYMGEGEYRRWLLFKIEEVVPGFQQPTQPF
jgi:hypothetical protein